jgi:arylsulfatase A-like enzyme/4-amino-4-deoxy-L-arabinose transferase-like glycosyltransferase
MAGGGARRPVAVLAALLLLAAALRVAAALTVGDVPALHGDETYYVEAGRAVARGLGYPDSVRPPGWPFLVAAVFRIFGESLTALRLVQVAVSLVAVALVYDVARRRYGPRAALVAGLFCAVLPELVHYTHFLWSETLFTTLLVLAIWALDRFEGAPRARWALVAGAALGLAALTREMILPFAPLAAAWVAAVAPGPAARKARCAALLLAACALVVLPWTVRNYGRHGQLVVVSTIRWFPMVVGNLLPADGSILGRDPEQQFAARYFAIPDELEREAMARDVALAAIAEAQPGWIARKLPRNIYGLFTPWTQLARFERSGWLPPRWQPLARVLVPLEMALTGLALALGVVGLWTVRRGRLEPLLAVLVLFFVALHVVANANHRFRLPLLPVYALFGGALLARPAAARRSRALVAGAGVSVAALAAVAATFLVRGRELSPAPMSPARRSIVLVSIDTLRPDHLGCYGYARPTSPHLDALAAAGTLFEQAYAPSSWTLPSHTSMLSGLSPFRHGAVDASVRIPDHVPLVAELLRARGYDTLGAVGNPFVSEHFGFRRGFARWLERRKSGTDPDGYQAEVLAELRGLRAPFFAFLHYNSVHHPYAPPPAYNRFAPAGSEGIRGARVGRLLHALEKGAPKVTPAEREMMVGLYDGEILAMDDRLGRTLGQLSRAFGDELLVVVTADHGEEFLEHGSLMHSRTLYDELLHVPLLVRGAGLPAGKRVREMVSLMDVAPTLLDWAGVPAPPGLDGRSLLPLARGTEARGAGLLPLHTRGHDKGVELWGLRAPGAKLIVDQRTGRREFYLLDEDPDEKHNRHADPRSAALARGLEALVLHTGASRPRLEPEEIEALNALGYR